MKRRNWMMTAPTILTSMKSAETPVILGHGDFRYRLNKKWSKADHTKTPVKNCHEMIQANDGRLFLLTDEARNNVLIYDVDGTLTGSWTLKMASAHGLTHHVDGDKETLWITDTRGRIVQTNLEGEVLQTLTHEGPNAPSGPTETAISPDGSIYVIDGYGSQYIYQYSSDGNFVKRFGGKSTQPVNETKFMQAHGIALDTRGPEPLLVCTARIKNEFKWFDLNGKFVKSIYLPGAFMSRPVLKGKELYSGVCFGFKKNDYRMWQGQGFILVLDENNKVISAPGAHKPHYDGDSLNPLMKEGDSFNNVHDVCVDKVGDLYACQWNSGRVPPYKLERV